MAVTQNDVKRMLALIGPAAIGQGAIQFNLLVSTSLAARFLEQGAVSFLYYADRLNQLPLGLIGIVAIVFSTQVNSKLNQGDLEGAQRASANAKTWCWVATAFAIIGLLINIAMFATGGMEQYMMMMEQIQQSQ